MKHSEDCKYKIINRKLVLHYPGMKSDCPNVCRCWCHKKYAKNENILKEKL
jgi:hypothetical protein